MLTLRHVGLFNSPNRIDVRLAGSEPGLLVLESGCVATGDIDATGWVLAPGLADPHVHFRDPGQTYKESMASGAAAAASGGYTRVLLMPNTVPPVDGQRLVAADVDVDEELREGMDEVLRSGCDNVIDYLQRYGQIHGLRLPVRYDLCVCASKGRLGIRASDTADWLRYVSGHDDAAKLDWQHEHPVVAISDDGSTIATGILDDVLANAELAGLPVIDHNERHESGAMHEGDTSRSLNIPGIPPETETAIVLRDIEAARRSGVHVHLQHVTTRQSFDLIRAAKREGLPVTCETAPHYLALCDEDVARYGTLAKMNPALRSADDRDSAREAVADGTVDMIATDHAPHTVSEKSVDFVNAPNGVIGLETAYGVCHSVLVDGGFITEDRLIELMSITPRQLVGRTTIDPALLLGNPAYDAHTNTLDLTQVSNPYGSELVDLTVLAPTDHWTIDASRFHSKARNTPFDGWDVTGRPMATILGSRLAFSRIPETRLWHHEDGDLTARHTP